MDKDLRKTYKKIIIFQLITHIITLIFLLIYKLVVNTFFITTPQWAEKIVILAFLLVLVSNILITLFLLKKNIYALIHKLQDYKAIVNLINQPITNAAISFLLNFLIYSLTFEIIKLVFTGNMMIAEYNLHFINIIFSIFIAIIQSILNYFYILISLKDVYNLISTKIVSIPEYWKKKLIIIQGSTRQIIIFSIMTFIPYIVLFFAINLSGVYFKIQYREKIIKGLINSISQMDNFIDILNNNELTSFILKYSKNHHNYHNYDKIMGNKNIFFYNKYKNEVLIRYKGEIYKYGFLPVSLNKSRATDILLFLTTFIFIILFYVLIMIARDNKNSFENFKVLFTSIAKQNFNNRFIYFSTKEFTDMKMGFDTALKSLKEFSSELNETYYTTIKTLAAAVDAKDPYTYGHSERVAIYSQEIAKEIDPSIAENNIFKFGAILHDIGKIGIEKNILVNNRRLTKDEYDIIKKHPIIGVNIIKSITFLKDAIPIIRNHHERWDGSGYPDGLKGKNIPLWARIVSVADAFDAMSTNRPYKSNRQLKEAFDEIVKNKGSQFDPEIVEAFVKFYNKKLKFDI